MDRADHGQHVLGAVDDLLRDDLARVLMFADLGYVAVDVRHRDDPALAVADRRGGDPDKAWLAGAGHPRRLEAGQLACDDLVPVVADALGEPVGVEAFHRLADDLLRGVAVKRLGGGIPRPDPAVEVIADDRVGGGLNQRAQKL